MSDHATTIAESTSTAALTGRDKWCVTAGAVAALSFAAIGNHAVAALTTLACVTPTIITTDLRERRIPTPLIHAGALVLVACVGVTAAVGEPKRVVFTVIGFATVGGAFLAVHLATPNGLGYGDVRLAALTGAAVAYGTGPNTATACAGLAAAAAGLFCVLGRRRSAPLAAYLLPTALISIAVRVCIG